MSTIYGSAFYWLYQLRKAWAWAAEHAWFWDDDKYRRTMLALAEVDAMLHDWAATHEPWVAFYRGL